MLRPYQVDAVRAALDAYYRHEPRGLIAIGTGGGKTVIMTCLAADLWTRGRVLIVAHRDELIQQIHSHLIDILKTMAIRVSIGIVQGEFRQTDAGIVIASTQTILNPETRSSMGTFNTCIIDEAHHYLANEYEAIVSAVNAPFTLGFTATPVRSEGAWLTQTFGPLVYCAITLGLVEDGYLCDFVEHDIPVPASVEAVVACTEAVVRQHHGHPIVYSARVAEAERIASLLREEGVLAHSIDGTTPPEIRERALLGFAGGSVEVLTNVAVLTEGVDLPIADAAIIGRICLSAPLLGQMVGRILRLRDGKDLARVYQFQPERHALEGFCGPTIPQLIDGMRYGLSCRQAMAYRYSGAGGDYRRECDQECFEAWVRSSWR